MPNMRKLLLRAAIGLAVIYVLFLGFITWAMHQPPETFGRVMSHMTNAVFLVAPFETLWTHARAGQLQPGQAAPEFSLTTLDHTSQISLASFRGKQPVVLVFGSYT